MTATKTSKPKQRAIAIVLPFKPASEEPAIVRITEGVRVKHVDEYFVDKIPSDYGQAFKMEKRDYKPGEEAQVYSVNIDAQHSSCDCLGHAYKGRCKHVEGLAVLLNAGKL